MDVNKLIESGASVDIRFHHHPSKEDAIKKLQEFDDIGGKIESDNSKGTYWVEIKKGKLHIVAFYDEETKK